MVCSPLPPVMVCLTTSTCPGPVGGGTAALASLVILPVTVQPLGRRLVFLLLLTKWSKIWHRVWKRGSHKQANASEGKCSSTSRQLGFLKPHHISSGEDNGWNFLSQLWTSLKLSPITPGIVRPRKQRNSSLWKQNRPCHKKNLAYVFLVANVFE